MQRFPKMPVRPLTKLTKIIKLSLRGTKQKEIVIVKYRNDI